MQQRDPSELLRLHAYDKKVARQLEYLKKTKQVVHIPEVGLPYFAPKRKSLLQIILGALKIDG